jgi:hypothetical protein
MRDTEMVLALLTLICGLMSAWFWYKASRVVPAPLKFGRVDPSLPSTSEMTWISGLLVAGNETARLSKIAALWTAVAVASGVVDNLIANWPA